MLTNGIYLVLCRGRHYSLVALLYFLFLLASSNDIAPFCLQRLFKPTVALPMSPSISARSVGSTDGGRGEAVVRPPPLGVPVTAGVQVSSCVGVVEEKTSCRHWHRQSHDSALNLPPLASTRFSKHEIPERANCSLSCCTHH